jgi:tocopherol O-methyltransferase
MILPRLDAATPDDVARHYDHLDRWYREIWGEHLHHGFWRTGRESPDVATRQLVLEAADAAGIGPGQKIVDVGCGYGATAELLARERGARVTGVTISHAQHERANARAAALGNETLTFLLRDWMDNRLESDSFDAGIAIESASHMPDKQRFFGELARVLRPGGRVALCVWAAADAPRNWEVRHMLEPICREGRLPGLATGGEYRAWMDEAGFEAVEIRDLSRAVRRTWTICATRCARRWLSDAELRRFVLHGRSPERIFGLTMFRLLAGFRTGAMRYLLVSGRVGDRPTVH